MSSQCELQTMCDHSCAHMARIPILTWFRQDNNQNSNGMDSTGLLKTFDKHGNDDNQIQLTTLDTAFRSTKYANEECSATCLFIALEFGVTNDY